MSATFLFASALFDIDGTLIDSNGAHARAWAQALREHGVDVNPPGVRPLIGMGGDKLIPALANVSDESPLGTRISRRKQELFSELLPTLQATRGARPLLEYLRAQGVTLVVATSADDDEMSALSETPGRRRACPRSTASRAQD